MNLKTDGMVDQIRSAVSDEVVIALNQVNKWYGEFHALKDLSIGLFYFFEQLAFKKRPINLPATTVFLK